VSIGRKYSRFVHARTDYWGTYPPTLSLSVGDLLEVNKDDSFKRVASTRDWPGWSEALPTDELPGIGEVGFSAHADRRLGGDAAVHGGAEPVLDGAASLTLSFAKASGFVMELQSDWIRGYRDQVAAKKRVAARMKNGDWEPDWVLVAEVLHATSATIAISEEKGSSVVLSAKAALPPAYNLADAALGLETLSTRGSCMVVTAKECTPLFRCLRVRRSWFGRRSVELQGLDEEGLDEAFSDDPFAGDV
jgi:hypothetical protein